jgi:hypothetical protein
MMPAGRVSIVAWGMARTASRSAHRELTGAPGRFRGPGRS